MKRRRKCPICKLYMGSTPHSGALHDRINANRRKVSRGLLGRFRRRKG